MIVVYLIVAALVCVGIGATLHGLWIEHDHDG